MRRKPEDLIGQKINRLHIQAVVKKQKGKKLVKCFICLCDCCSVCEPIAEKVMRDLTISCGCYAAYKRLDLTKNSGILSKIRKFERDYG